MSSERFAEELARGEGQTQEFKTSLSQTDSGLQSLCGMINADAARGTVFFGVAPDGRPDGVEEGNLDSAQRKLAQKTHKFDPPIQATIELIECEGKRLLKVSATRSTNAPFHEYDGRAYVREGSSTRKLSVAEKQALLMRNRMPTMNQYQESLDGFLEERKRTLADLAQGRPWLMLMATPVHIDRDKLDPLREDIRDLLTDVPGRPDRRYMGIYVGRPQPRVFGIEASSPDPLSPGSHTSHAKVLRLYRNGHLEFGESLEAPQDWPDQVAPIYSYRVSVLLMHFLSIAGEVLRLGEVREPIAVTMHLENVNPSQLDAGMRWRNPRGGIVWQEERITLRKTVPELSNTPAIARSLIDRLFNAYGFDVNPHFDDDSKLVR